MQTNKIRKVGLLINSMGMGGAERVVSTILKAFVSEGIAVTLICIEDDFFYEIPNEIDIEILSSKKFTSWEKVLGLFTLAMRLKNVVTRKGLDHVLSMSNRANYVNVLSRFIGSHHKVTIAMRSNPSLYNSSGLKKHINLLLMKLLYPFADEYFFQTDAMRQEYKSYCSMKKPFSIIFNPIDTEKITSLCDEESVQMEDEYICMLGRLEHVKRIDIALSAFKIAKDKLGSIPNLVIVGDGPERDRLEDLSRSMSLERSVIFAGKKANPYGILRHAMFFVLSSESEGFPNALIEALACGLPVITTDCVSGPREILGPVVKNITEAVQLRKWGITVETNNPSALAAAMELFVIDAEVRKHLASEAKNRAKDFDISSISEKFYSILFSDTVER